MTPSSDPAPVTGRVPARSSRQPCSQAIGEAAETTAAADDPPTVCAQDDVDTATPEPGSLVEAVFRRLAEAAPSSPPRGRRPAAAPGQEEARAAPPRAGGAGRTAAPGPGRAARTVSCERLRSRPHGHARRCPPGRAARSGRGPADGRFPTTTRAIPGQRRSPRPCAHPERRSRRSRLPRPQRPRATSLEPGWRTPGPRRATLRGGAARPDSGSRRNQVLKLIHPRGADARNRVELLDRGNAPCFVR